MSDLNEMLELRKRIKRKKPIFLRQDFQIKKLKRKWIKAKGVHSKMRKKMAGHILMPNPGFGSPRAVRGLNADGLREVIVSNADGLAKVGQGCCAVVGRNVGTKKRIDIAKKASQMGIKISNLSDDFVKNAEEAIKKRKEENKAAIDQKHAKKEEAKKIADEKKHAKEEEKEMKKKVLEKKV